MDSNFAKKFQATVADRLVRHKSILDVTSKLQETSARVNRATMKAVTQCGCITIGAEKQPFSSTNSLEEMAKYVQTHLEGKLCPNCQEAIETELGKAMFYYTALCVILGFDLEKIITHEDQRINSLGKYSLT